MAQREKLGTLEFTKEFEENAKRGKHPVVGLTVETVDVNTSNVFGDWEGVNDKAVVVNTVETTPATDSEPQEPAETEEP